MSFKIAIGSSDGKVVNQHFGSSRQFIIYKIDVENKTSEFIQTRQAKPPCCNGEHTSDDMRNACSSLSDCRYVVMNKIGSGAIFHLSQNGIEAIEYFGLIEDFLNSIIK